MANAALLGAAAALITRAIGAQGLLAVRPGPVMSVLEFGLLGYRARPLEAVPFAMAHAVATICLATFVWSAAFAFLASRFPVLIRHPLLFGAAAGALYYRIVILVVAALRHDDDRGLVPLTVEVIFLGLPMALTVSLAPRRYRNAEV